MHKLKIGFFPHWFQPAYRIITRMQENTGYNVREIDFRKPDYLEDFDVIIIEQNGFNDYIENDNKYINDFIRRGGICWIMHQDYRRWSSYFLPIESGHPILVNRYIETIRPSEKSENFFSYMMAQIEADGEDLFAYPNQILPEEMIYWEIPGNSFDLIKMSEHTETIKSSATSCIINCKKWTILGSYCDATIQDGALVSELKLGKGLFFWNQILFPEEITDTTDRIFSFWDKYIENVLYHFEVFRNQKIYPLMPPKKKSQRLCKQNYKTLIHLHSLDWYGADASLNTIRAAMRYDGFDIGILSIKDAVPYGNELDLDKYSDDSVLLLPGQEFHPFNWDGDNDKNPNSYHTLSLGVDSYTTAFTKSLFSDEDVRSYLNNTIFYIKEHGGVSCATHPYSDYWKDYDFEAVDILLKNNFLSGSDVEKFYLNGGKITVIVSVDMWGVQRLREYPVFNFIYTDGLPTSATVLQAIKKGHVMPAINMEKADIRLGDCLPGDNISVQQAMTSSLEIFASSKAPLNELRIYCCDQIIYTENLLSEPEITRNIPLCKYELNGFIRVEVIGVDAMLVTNPFYLK